jgi:hypothetical protein
VIVDGETGVIVAEHTEMVAAIPKADAIDPLACRRYVEERFSSERMVRDYENAYELALRNAGADVGEGLLEVGDQVVD